ncbi:DUF6894 family protein [Methylobacterium symbioticum]|uniref:DUF6894 domain-containing protein n=1 Tax=Methylobacterium symbioticum TaxID=2584084 RepID=A0A509E8T9_9HYPH|nr:hypothetical protein [Methylobacterium symbioticum]VUD70015.1 hypothetical protein MET9862_00576 [Methylobacterium symbioticum]
MPRYFFDLDAPDMAGHTAFTDLTGTEFPDVEAARRAALQFLPHYAGDALRPVRDQHTFNLQVRDESGDIVYRARLVLNGQRL